MPVQFCKDCGDLLPVMFNKMVTCECCGLSNRNEMLDAVSVSSTCHFPSKLRDKRGPVNVSDKLSSGDTWATIDEQCPNCHARNVRYTTLQLKSADEGSTVFYSCDECSTRWKEDN